MGHLPMEKQGLQSTRKTTPDIELEVNCNTNVVFCASVDPSTTHESKFYSELCRRFPIVSNKENIYIYVIYV